MDINNYQLNLSNLKENDLHVNAFFKSGISKKQFQTEINKLVEIQKQLNGMFFLTAEQNSFYIKITLNFDKNYYFPFLSTDRSTKQQRIEFQITITRDYPLKGVRLYCKTFIENPSISDGRDILLDVLDKRWNNLISFQEIYDKIPPFVQKFYDQKITEEDNQSKRYLKVQKLGRFYLGHTYLTQDIKQLQGVLRFPCVQYENSYFQKLIYVRIILITDCHYILFDVDEQEDSICTCIFFADLQSIEQITKKRNEPQKMKLVWKNYFYDQKIEQDIQMSDCDRAIKEVIKRIQYFQRVKIDSNSYMNYGETWDKEKQNIERIIAQIEIYEDEIKHIFNKQNIQQLVSLYNEAIEHYSAAGDYLYDIFKNKLQNLLRRNDVQTLLSFKQDDGVFQRSKSMTVGEKEDEKLQDLKLENRQKSKSEIQSSSPIKQQTKDTQKEEETINNTDQQQNIKEQELQQIKISFSKEQEQQLIDNNSNQQQEQSKDIQINNDVQEQQDQNHEQENQTHQDVDIAQNEIQQNQQQKDNIQEENIKQNDNQQQQQDNLEQQGQNAQKNKDQIDQSEQIIQQQDPSEEIQQNNQEENKEIVDYKEGEKEIQENENELNNSSQQQQEQNNQDQNKEENKEQQDDIQQLQQQEEQLQTENQQLDEDDDGEQGKLNNSNQEDNKNNSNEIVKEVIDTILDQIEDKEIQQGVQLQEDQQQNKEQDDSDEKEKENEE